MNRFVTLWTRSTYATLSANGPIYPLFLNILDYLIYKLVHFL